jgi:ubiquinol-cytochrome c reductase cytochrome c subunit
MSAARRALVGWGLVALALAALVAWGRAAGAQEEPDGGAGPLDGIEEGGQIYALQCAQCHGADGAGGPMDRYEGEAPSLLPRDNPNISAAYLDLVMSTGRMPPAGSPYDNRERRVVSEDERERRNVVAWMQREFGIPGEVPLVDVEEGDTVRGQQVWNTNCAHCHGATGAGGVAGAGAWTPSVSDSSAQTIYEAIRVGPFQMPQFSEAQISDQEAVDVAAFMHEVAAEEGTPLFGLVELNPVYASAFVALLALVTLVSLVWIGGRPAWFPDAEKKEQQPEIPSGASPRTPSSSTAPSSPRTAPGEDGTS